MDTTLLQGLALLETQDGARTIKGPNGADSFNLFNIKDFSKQGSGYRARDKAEGSNDRYRVYSSREESIQDLIGLLERKYPQALEALKAGDAQGFASGLKAGGYATDPQYESKLVSTIEGVRKNAPKAEVAQAITSSAAEGESAATQLSILRQNGYAEFIDDATTKGYNADEIVKYIAGESQKVGEDASKRRESAGVLSTAKDRLVDVGQQLARGAKQIVADDEGTARLQAEEAADRVDPDKLALRNTTTAKVTGVLPYAAAAFIPGANTVVGAGALGATLSALQPTVQGESRLENAAVGGLTAGGAVGAAKALATGTGALARATQSAQRGGRSVDEINATIKALEDQGISVSARDISPMLNRAANTAERTWGGNVGQADRALTREQALARALTRRLGKESDTLDSTYVAEAQKRIGTQFDEALQGVSVEARGLISQLDDIIAKQEHGALPSLQNAKPRIVAEELKAKLAAGPISASELQLIRSTIGKELSSSSIDGSTRTGLGEISNVLTKALDEGLPAESALKYRAANDQWRKLQAAENLVRSTNDTGEITAKKLASAIKQGKLKNAYERGDAPYQDLQKALGSLEDSKQTLFGSALDANSVQMLGAYASGGVSLPLSGLTANAALRILNSTNPRIRSMLLGMSPVKQAELKRLALGAALGSMSPGA